VTIQIEQTFPHCERCGKMLHWRMPRIAAQTSEGETIAFCSELCQKEHEARTAPVAGAQWHEGSTAPAGRRHGVAV
jgi:hypothetical protein